MFQAGLNDSQQPDRHWHYNLLMAQLLADPESTEYDIAQAFRFVSRAAESGDYFSLYLVGWHYSEGAGVLRDDARAVYFFQQSANQGYPPAQYMIGLAYQRGYGVTPDLAVAAHWHRLAAEAGHELAQERLREIEERLPTGKDS